MFSLEELFCSVDDFCSDFEPGWKQHLLTQGKCRLRNRRLSLSEIMTIRIAFHCSRLGTSTGIGFIDSTSIKVGQHGCISWGNPSLYNHHNRRIKQHRVFKAMLFRGKTSVDWFCGATPLGLPQHDKGLARMYAHQDGFKLHLAINHRRELLNIALTTGNIIDANRTLNFAIIEKLSSNLK